MPRVVFGYKIDLIDVITSNESKEEKLNQFKRFGIKTLPEILCFARKVANQYIYSVLPLKRTHDGILTSIPELVLDLNYEWIFRTPNQLLEDLISNKILQLDFSSVIVSFCFLNVFSKLWPIVLSASIDCILLDIKSNFSWRQDYLHPEYKNYSMDQILETFYRPVILTFYQQLSLPIKEKDLSTIQFDLNRLIESVDDTICDYGLEETRY